MKYTLALQKRYKPKGPPPGGTFLWCSFCGNAWADGGCPCEVEHMRPLPDQTVAEAAWRLGGRQAVYELEIEEFVAMYRSKFPTWEL